jgi:hypothetical protein
MRIEATIRIASLLRQPFSQDARRESTVSKSPEKVQLSGLD